ncbi:MAG: cation diffusion facilitator family transporter [Pseudomonadota bacterium]|nr:cation diffusion facilitator family transporter [Pseudomonadota bacterium]
MASVSAAQAPQQGSAVKAIFYAFLANTGIALAKTWAAIYTGSSSMTAEAIHSFADAGNQVLLFRGLKQSQRPADSEHPLGYGKLSYFWSFVVALMLFSLGGLFSIYEGMHKLQETEPVRQVWVGLLVLAVAVVLEFLSLLGALREIRHLRRNKSLVRWLRTTRNAELVVVLGEDTAALIGLTLAFIFLGTAAITGNPAYDAAGSIAIGIVLIIVSVFIAARIKGLLIGRSAEPELQARIDAIIADDPAIDMVFNTITIQMGPKIMLAAKILLPAGMPTSEAVTHINALERRLKAEIPQIGWCFIEPDITDA